MDKHNIDIVKAQYEDLQSFIYEESKSISSVRTQARLIAGIHSFYRFLLYHNYIQQDPSELLESPKKEHRLPDVLTLDEIDSMIAQLDMSKPESHRNRAIIEMLYGSGLRVSELVNLKLSDIYRQEGFMRIIGKGNKQRLVPISPVADEWLDYWLKDRSQLDIKTEYNDIVFLNRYGRQLTRAMIFTIIKTLARQANIHKTISPPYPATLFCYTPIAKWSRPTSDTTTTWTRRYHHYRNIYTYRDTRLTRSHPKISS
jgi:integrase/recombinase XerD